MSMYFYIIEILYYSTTIVKFLLIEKPLDIPDIPDTYVTTIFKGVLNELAEEK